MESVSYSGKNNISLQILLTIPHSGFSITVIKSKAGCLLWQCSMCYSCRNVALRIYSGRQRTPALGVFFYKICIFHVLPELLYIIPCVSLPPELEKLIILIFLFNNLYFLLADITDFVLHLISNALGVILQL